MPELVELKGVGPVLAKACAERGYESVETIAAAKADDLVVVRGISPARAQMLIEAARTLLNGGSATEATVADVGGGPAVRVKPAKKDNGKKKKKNKKKRKKDKKNKKGKKQKSKKKK